MAMSFQRYGETVSSPSSRMSTPSKKTLPETDAVGGNSPISAMFTDAGTIV